MLGRKSKSNDFDPPPPGNGWIAITAGAYHTCALHNLGEARCWNWDATGADDEDEGTEQPDPEAPPIGFVEIEAGEQHTCGVSHDGEIICWGLEANEALGQREEGRDAPEGTDWLDISAG